MPTLIDLTGQRFGRWTVLEKAPSKNKAVYWVCQCDCGTIKEVKAASLRNGDSKSCGCYKSEASAKRLSEIGKKNLVDLQGKTFGDLTVLYLCDYRGDNGRAFWHCKCSCGNEIEVPGSRLTTGNITHCGCKQIISKGEEKIRKILSDNNIIFQTQKIFDSCKYSSGQPARFDFWVNNSYIIEFDGRQHFDSSEKGWMTKEKVAYTQEHDKIKNEWCRNNNILLIRIPYTQYDNLCLEDLLPNTSTFIYS